MFRTVTTPFALVKIIGNTPKTARGMPMYDMMSVAVAIGLVARELLALDDDDDDDDDDDEEEARRGLQTITMQYTITTP
jgi:hypothetical protein